MSDFEQRRSERQHPAVPENGPVAPLHPAPAYDSSQFQSFPQKRLAMQQLLRTIVEQRASRGAYRNPWSGLSEEQLVAYTDQVIDRLQKIRTRDLSVAYAIYLEGKEGDREPEERLEDLGAALETTQEWSHKLQGGASESNKTYQKQLERDIKIHKRIVENRADMRERAEGVDEKNVGRKSNISTLLLSSQEKPGYVRVYMTVVAPSSDERYKDLHKDGHGNIMGRSNQLWLNVGSPGRALSYVNSYRLQMNPGDMPVVRSMLVPVSFLAKHWAESFTENPKHKSAVKRWHQSESSSEVNPLQEKRTDALVESWMNTDSKFPNQFGLNPLTEKITTSREVSKQEETPKEERKPKVLKSNALNKRKALKKKKALEKLKARKDREEQETQETQGPALPWWKEKMQPDELYDKAEAIKARKLNYTDPDPRYDFKTVTTTANPAFLALLKAADPDSFVTYSNPDEFRILHNEKLDGKRADFHSLASSIGLTEKDDNFIVHVLRTGEQEATAFSIKNGRKWTSPNTAELGQIVEYANHLFGELDALPHNDAVNQQAIDDAGTHLFGPLGDLLDANRLTPGALLSSQGPLNSRKRDRYGNSAVRAAFEEAFSDEYLKSKVWQGHMGKWSASLAASIKRELSDEPASLKALYAKPYVQQDMKSLREMAKPIQASDPVAALEELSKGDSKNSPVDGRHVDLLFHLLRGLGEVKEGLKASKLDGQPFAVNNRIQKTFPFDVVNPQRSPHGGPADPMRSTNRFEPNTSAETRLMQDLDVPFVGGVSGTTRDYNNMMNAVFGDMSPDEFWRFQLLNASFMVKHGYHSMFEAFYPATFYERTRGDAIRDEYDALRRRRRPTNSIDFYRPALTAALGNQGVKLWKTARKRARRRLARQIGAVE